MINKKGILSKIERRELIYRKYKGRCAYCGYKISLQKMTIDHIIPKQSFFNKVILGNVPFFMRNLTTQQLNHFDNLNPCCVICNVLKSSLSFEEFIIKIKKMKYTSKNHRLKRRILKGREYKFHFELHLAKKISVFVGSNMLNIWNEKNSQSLTINISFLNSKNETTLISKKFDADDILNGKDEFIIKISQQIEKDLLGYDFIEKDKKRILNHFVGSFHDYTKTHSLMLA